MRFLDIRLHMRATTTIISSFHCRPFISAGSQISQKIKSTYKTSTSRLANTFKSGINQSGCAQFVRLFASHTDGVWEVSVSQYGPARVIGTASAGNLHLSTPQLN